MVMCAWCWSPERIITSWVSLRISTSCDGSRAVAGTPHLECPHGAARGMLSPIGTPMKRTTMGQTTNDRNERLPELKADLLRPEAYGALRPTRVDLAETHISWVFLVDRDVFKVKKPVNLGFVDFRTIRQRKTACEAEVYRGVVPVLRGKDGHSFIGGEGPIVDWAVHMARLPDDRRADLLLARG